MTVGACDLLERRSGECTIGISFGCNGDQIWVAAGCRGIFRCGATKLLCPSHDVRRDSRLNATCGCKEATGPSAPGWANCPADGDLEDAGALAALVHARRSPRRDLAVLLYGPAAGSTAQLSLGEERGLRFLQAQIGSLRRLSGGGEHHLVISPRLGVVNHPLDNVCLTSLRPRGICCGWSRAGIDYYPAWGLAPTHPFVLFPLRFWLAARILSLGVNVLYVDLDVHLSQGERPVPPPLRHSPHINHAHRCALTTSSMPTVPTASPTPVRQPRPECRACRACRADPFDLVRLPGLRAFDLLWHGDEGWPVRRGSRLRVGPGELFVDCADQSEAESSEEERGEGGRSKGASLLPSPQLRRGRAAAVESRAGAAAGGGCACGVTSAPKVNTGFFWARATGGRGDAEGGSEARGKATAEGRGGGGGRRWKVVEGGGGRPDGDTEAEGRGGGGRRWKAVEGGGGRPDGDTEAEGRGGGVVARLFERIASLAHRRLEAGPRRPAQPPQQSPSGSSNGAPAGSSNLVRRQGAAHNRSVGTGGSAVGTIGQLQAATWSETAYYATVQEQEVTAVRTRTVPCAPPVCMRASPRRAACLRRWRTS